MQKNNRYFSYFFLHVLLMFNDFFAGGRTTRNPRQRWVRSRRLSWRGVRWRGVRWRGVRSRGVRSRGVRSRGVRRRGLRWRGLKSRGVKSRGVKNRGVRSRGVRWRGVRSRREVQLQLSQLPLPVQHQGRAQRPCPHAPFRYRKLATCIRSSFHYFERAKICTTQDYHEASRRLIFRKNSVYFRANFLFIHFFRESTVLFSSFYTKK
jgi:hypothetical protein